MRLGRDSRIFASFSEKKTTRSLLMNGANVHPCRRLFGMIKRTALIKANGESWLGIGENIMMEMHLFSTSLGPVLLLSVCLVCDRGDCPFLPGYMMATAWTMFLSGLVCFILLGSAMARVCMFPRGKYF